MNKNVFVPETTLKLNDQVTNASHKRNYKGALINVSQKVMLNRKMNKVLHPKRKGNNCFTKMVKIND